jgi:hypothetical protein
VSIRRGRARSALVDARLAGGLARSRDASESAYPAFPEGDCETLARTVRRLCLGALLDSGCTSLELRSEVQHLLATARRAAPTPEALP